MRVGCRHGHTIVVPTSGLYAGKLVMFGGKCEDSVLAELWCYDPETAEVNPLRVSHCATD